MSGISVGPPDSSQMERSGSMIPPALVPHMPRHRGVFLAAYLCLLFPATAGGLGRIRGSAVPKLDALVFQRTGSIPLPTGEANSA